MASRLDGCNCPRCFSAQLVPSEDPPVDVLKPLVTPLPKLQLFIIVFIQIAEPVTSTVIYPFVNDLVRALGITGGDEKKTGYYVGLIVSFSLISSTIFTTSCHYHLTGIYLLRRGSSNCASMGSCLRQHRSATHIAGRYDRSRGFHARLWSIQQILDAHPQPLCARSVQWQCRRDEKCHC